MFVACCELQFLSLFFLGLCSFFFAIDALLTIFLNPSYICCRDSGERKILFYPRQHQVSVMEVSVQKVSISLVIFYSLYDVTFSIRSQYHKMVAKLPFPYFRVDWGCTLKDQSLLPFLMYTSESLLEQIVKML